MMVQATAKGSGATEDTSIGRSNASHPLSGGALLTALGIVFGDLGTSPLYTMQAISRAIGGQLDATSAMGSLSLIVWALIITVSVKYCLLVMCADNHGEGGILALMSSTRLSWHGRHWPLVACGLFGAALIYGDGVITPAISVLSALEGMNVATDQFAPYVMPAAVAILAALFAIQRLGTARVGRAFGPIMLIWFVVLGAMGIASIVRQPAVLAAVNPAYAISFLIEHGLVSLTVLGAVFLAVTGGEALYADMGHVGSGPIRLAWFAIVLPALLLGYAGQTALYVGGADVSGSPFFRMAPEWALYPLVGLATFATIIASQAIITGAFSLTRQAMQLGWLPGMRIQQTSSDEYGQIYVPFVNWTMMALTIALTVGFASSDRLAGAYGTAVSTTMLLTTILLYRVMHVIWRWRTVTGAAIFCVLFAVDFTFFIANLLKIEEGGWIPLLLGAVIMTVMTTWRSGFDAIHRAQHRRSKPVAEFQQELAHHRHRSPHTAIFLTRLAHDVPSLIVDHVEQLGALPKVMIALSVHFTDHPRIRDEDRVQIEQICSGFWHVSVRYGFMEIPDLPATLKKAQEAGCGLRFDDAVYFVARDRPVRRSRHPRLSGWRRAMFAFLLRNGVHAMDLFKLPPANFVEIGREIEI
jgi:KUP system potassium uptake protein